MPNWIDQILAITDEVETPRSYIRWAAMAAISAVVKKNVYFSRQGYWRIYPNLFIMLVGPSGITKSYATSSIAKALVKAVGNIKIIDGQNSIEGILQELATGRTNEKGEIDKPAHAFIVANEFTNLILDNPQAFSLLTELYDACYNLEWTKRLKSGTIVLKDPAITMIVATNKAHFDDKLQTKDIEGGFIGRFIVVNERKLHRINSLVEEGGIGLDIPVLSERLREIAKIKGEFKFASKAAKEHFKDWYKDFRSNTQEDETGMYRRIPDSVFKVAMINSLAEKDELTLNLSEIENAIETCLGIVTNIKNITAGSGSSPDSGKMMKFMQCLINAPEYRVEHGQMLRKNYTHFDMYDLGKIAETLQQANVIKIESAGPKKYYVMTDLAVVKYMKEKDS